MAGGLGRPRDPARLLAGQQRVRPALVQPAPARLGDLLVDRVAQQRVAKPDAAVGGRSAGRSAAPRRRPRPGRRSGSWASSTGSSGRAATAASSTSLRTSPGSGASVARTDPRRLGATSLAPAPERPRGLDGEQRVALGALDHPLHVGVAQRAPRCAPARPPGLRQRPERQLAASSPAGAQRVLERSACGAVRQLAPRDQHHHRQPGDAAGGVAGQLEARASRRCGRPRARAAAVRSRGGPARAARRPPRTAACAEGRAAIAALGAPPRAKCAGSSPVSTARSSGQAASAGGAGSAGSSSRISSAHRLSGAAPPRSSAAQAAVSAPAARARSRSSLASRVLPIPASPRITAAAPRPGGRRAPRTPRARASSRSRPTQRQHAGRAAGHARAGVRRGRLARSRSTSSRVWARRRHAELAAQALGQRAIGCASRRRDRRRRRAASISRRCASSSNGSRSTCRRVQLDRLARPRRAPRGASELLEQRRSRARGGARARTAPTRPRAPRAARRGRARAPPRGSVSAEPLELADVDPQLASSRSPTRSPSTDQRIPSSRRSAHSALRRLARAL